MSATASEMPQWIVDQRAARIDAETARQAKFKALKILLPVRLADVRELPPAFNLESLEADALEREIENQTWARATEGGKITPTNAVVAAMRNELRPIITEKFRTLGVAGYVAEKLKSATETKTP